MALSASQPPSASTATCPNAGIVCIAGCSRAWMFTSRTRDANMRRERSVSRSSSRCSWPKPFTTRTPVTSSSTTLATSPAFCCASQLAGNTDVRSRIAVKSSAGATSEHHAARAAATGMNIDDERHDEQQDVRDADRQELQEALDQRDVGRRAAHELTGLQLVVAREVEPLQLPEDRRCAGRAARRARCDRRGTGGSTRTRTSTTPMTIISASHGASGLLVRR